MFESIKKQEHQHKTPQGASPTGKHPLQALADQSPRTLQLKKLQDTANAQQKSTGSPLPGELQSSIQEMTGMSLNEVTVHYNSPQPAQVQAHAFARGNEIHLAPGQEKHLPHEAWHVVQQRQGRVRPTAANSPINDDAGLEKEADTMGSQLKP